MNLEGKVLSPESKTYAESKELNLIKT